MPPDWFKVTTGSLMLSPPICGVDAGEEVDSGIAVCRGVEVIVIMLGGLGEEMVDSCVGKAMDAVGVVIEEDEQATKNETVNKKSGRLTITHLSLEHYSVCQDQVLYERR